MAHRADPVASSRMGTAGSARPERKEGIGDALLYATAAISYVAVSVYNKWLLDWIVGPLWCVLWVWGIPALWRFVHGRPVRPQRGPRVSKPGSEQDLPG